jgi:S1-C subfamily serine protease
MKLYTRRFVVILGIALGLVAVGAGVLVTALVIVPNAVQRQIASLPVSGVLAQTTTAPTTTPVQFSTTTATLNTDGVGEDERNNILVYDKTNKAVVNITTQTMVNTWYYQQVPQEGTGSGVIIDQQGHVLTNNHVISGADAISITLADGTVADGKLVGTDPENDIAILQFNPKGKTLTTIPFGDSSLLKVGMKVLAIGNPFALDRTLTTGIVSGLQRPLQTEEGYLIRETIQTDAAINPGNSGGPLLNSSGQLIGINTAIKSTSGSSAGVGFAIPVNTVKPIAEELILYGKVKRGTLDIEGVDLFPQLVQYFNMSVQKGVLVNAVGSTAQQAGLRAGSNAVRTRQGQGIYGGGDIIIEVNGQAVEGMTDIYSALEKTKPGEVATVKVLRGSRTMSFTVKLVEEITATSTATSKSKL